MGRKILFFVNPIAGTKSKLQLEKQIIKRCEEENLAFEILFTSKDGDYDFLRERIAIEGITDIVICGGDGSISPVISSLLKTEVNIGIIPRGSGNGLARTARIPKSVDKALDIILKGNASRVDAFTINDRLSCHVCGLGFDALVAHEFSKQRTRGLSTYTRETLKHFFSIKPYAFSIEVEGKHFKTDAFLLCIANSNQFGNNFKIAPKASICDGLLDIVILKKTSKIQIVVAFVKQILFGQVGSISTKKLKENNLLYFQTQSIKIENPDLAPLHIDGDPTETSRRFSIEILPGAYRLLQP
ncbi:MAG: diacylglycerol kinase family protein [Ginsengibacter sp.]